MMFWSCSKLEVGHQLTIICSSEITWIAAIIRWYALHMLWREPKIILTNLIAFFSFCVCQETVSILLCLKVRFPQRITMTRGNHECRQITQVCEKANNDAIHPPKRCIKCAAFMKYILYYVKLKHLFASFFASSFFLVVSCRCRCTGFMTNVSVCTATRKCGKNSLPLLTACLWVLWLMTKYFALMEVRSAAWCFEIVGSLEDYLRG